MIQFSSRERDRVECLQRRTSCATSTRLTGFAPCPPPHRICSPKLSSTDFAQLREALLHQSGPSRLPILDRDDVLQAHNALVARERALADEVRTRKAVVGPGKHFSSVGRLEDLKRVGLDPTELGTDEIARGARVNVNRPTLD